MKALPLRPLPVPGEPLSDYLERLGNANGYHAGKLWSVLDHGDYPDEQVLSEALRGHILPTFSGPAVPHVNIPVESFGLRTDDFTHYYRRWCPLCIEAEAWLRPVWRIKVTTVCDIHQVKLLQECPNCRQSTNVQEILRGTCNCGIFFKKFVIPAARPQMQLAHALATSLSGNATLRLKDVEVKLTTAQLVRMICYTGRLIEGTGSQTIRPGRVSKMGDLSVAFKHTSGAAALLADWPNAFWHCLERYVEASPGEPGVKRVFGDLYSVIYRDLNEPAFQFWRDAFELFLLNHWRGYLCGRNRLFQKETIQAFPNRGLAQVARMTGVGSKTLKRMVHQDSLPGNCFTGRSKREFITIDSTNLPLFMPDATDYLDMRGAARYLGIKRTRLRHLVASEAILADAKPAWARRDRWYFRRSEVVGFMEQMRQASLPKLSDDITVTLNHALRYWRVTDSELSKLLGLMRRGKIDFFLAGDGQLRDVTFGENILRDWLHRHRSLTNKWVSVPAAAKLLCLKQEVVYQLVKKNFLVAESRRIAGIMKTLISRMSLESFRQEFVSLATLAAQQNTSPKALLDRLHAWPVTGPKVDGSRQYFYRREGIQADIVSGS